MRLRRPSLYLAFIVLTATLTLGGQISSDRQVVVDENAIVLPTGGTLDERSFFSSRRHPAIDYADRPSTDVVGQLARKVDEGTVSLRFDKTSGYLLSVLEALHVPVESQSVVFSKTSLQSHYINPSNPRALFYSDDVSVGFIRNAPLLEIATLDPQQGIVFYALENRPIDRPQIVRGDSCLSCHEARNTLGVPGLLARSMGVGPGGQTLPQIANYNSDHRSPFEERWGGWFITGKTGPTRHLGNTMAGADVTYDTAGSAVLESKALDSLAGQFDLEGYPSPYSDVAAVMVLNHQVRMTNMLIRVGWETRVALDRQEKNPKEKQAVQRIIAADAAELVDYMLFVNEAALPGKFESTSGFPAKFAATGPRDGKGRSLRQLALEKRLMRYPCSYMIYSPAFDQLPAAAKDAAYSRLWTVLSGKDNTPKYSKLSAADRNAIVSILLETKQNLPAYFKRLEK